MIKKQNSPAFIREKVPMSECPACSGAGLIQGVFHQLECIACHSSGLVHAVTELALPVDDLVIQLGIRVRHLSAMLDRVERDGRAGESRQYEQNNRRGAGGSNFTGD